MQQPESQAEARSRRNIRKTRRQTLDAARRQLAEKGLAGARMETIAGQAGVSRAMVYPAR